MSSQIPENIDPIELISISDPGERNREEHVWSDRVIVHIANIVSWLFPLLIFAIVAQVVLRKLGANQAWLDDAQWWLYGFAMMVGFMYAITTNSHVRVDILHQNYSIEKKAKIEIFALGWLLLSFLIIMTDIMMHYAISSWVASEGSDSPNGLHKLYLLKATLPVLFALSMLATCAALYRNLRLITTPTVWKFLICTFPAVWFACERFSYYVLWWFTHLSNPDLHVRRVAREPILQQSTWIGLGLLILIIAVSFGISKRKAARD